MDPRSPSRDGRDRRAIPRAPSQDLPPPRYKRPSLALSIYTGATIVAGLAALAWASVSYPIWPTIGQAFAAEQTWGSVARSLAAGSR